MTHDIYIVKNIVKTTTSKHKQTDVLLYVNDGCGLNNCYSIKKQENYCVSRARVCTLGGVDKIGPDRNGSDRTGSRIGSRIGSHKKKNFKKKIKKIKTFMS